MNLPFPEESDIKNKNERSYSYWAIELIILGGFILCRKTNKYQM